MAAALQGFPEDWRISGRKTAGYRQIGNAFPPPVAHAVGVSIRAAIEASRHGQYSEPEGRGAAGEGGWGGGWGARDERGGKAGASRRPAGESRQHSEPEG